MARTLSTWATEFLKGDHVAVVCTLNKDGSPFATTIWYLLQEDGTLIMNTPGGTQKVKNLQGIRASPFVWGMSSARSVSMGR